MAILPILSFPDPRLRTKARAIDGVTDEIRQLAADMLATMYAAPGIGLAASQVDRHIQLIVMDLSESQNEPQVFVNPKITPLTTDTKRYDEGCLSVPDAYEGVERIARVRIEAFDLDGREIVIDADDLLAVCIQHEIDHLNGVLFVDHISALKRKRIRDSLVKAEREKKRDQAAATNKPKSPSSAK